MRRVSRRCVFTCLLTVGSFFAFHRFYSEWSEEFFNVEMPPDVGGRPWRRSINYDGNSTNSDDLVPNIVHFIRFGKSPLTYVEAVCVLAALKNQDPRLLIIHSDQWDFDGGQYWQTLKAVSGIRLLVLHRKLPTHVFGQRLSSTWHKFHASDLARLQVLMEFGGIFLDNDSYLVKSLDNFRKFELTVSWPSTNPYLQNQVIVAHKDARFLRLWLKSYQNDYQPNDWNYNCQKKPVKILSKQPHLIHRVTDELLPPDWNSVFPLIYREKSDDWRRYHVIHFFIRHQHMMEKDSSKAPTVELNEEQILSHNASIKYMALEVWPKAVDNTVTAESRTKLK